PVERMPEETAGERQMPERFSRTCCDHRAVRQDGLDVVSHVRRNRRLYHAYKVAVGREERASVQENVIHEKGVTGQPINSHHPPELPRPGTAAPHTSQVRAIR